LLISNEKSKNKNNMILNQHQKRLRRKITRCSYLWFLFSLVELSNGFPTSPPLRRHYAITNAVSLLQEILYDDVITTTSKSFFTEDVDEDDKNNKKINWSVTKNNCDLLSTTSELLISRGKRDSSTECLNQNKIQKIYNTMEAWSRISGDDDDDHNNNVAATVELLFQLLKDENQVSKSAANALNTQTYNIVIDAWSKSNDKHAAQRAEELLEEMEKANDNNNIDAIKIKPDRTSYECVIKAWVKQQSNSTHLIIEKVEDLIDRMKKNYSLNPSRRGYNLLLYAYAHYSSKNNSNVAAESESILNEMMQSSDELLSPDINTFNLILKIWSQSRTKEYKDKTEELFEKIIIDDTTTNNTKMIIFPNVDTFSAIFSCWLKSSSSKKDYAVVSENMMNKLKLLENLYRDTSCIVTQNNTALKPNIIIMNSISTALAKSAQPNAMDRVMELRNYMENSYGIKADTISNNIIIDLLSRRRDKDAYIEAVNVLMKIEDDFKNGKCHKPDNYSYISVLNCLAKSSNPTIAVSDEAMKLLNRMKATQKDYSGDAPNLDCYNAVLNCISTTANDDDCHAAGLAFSILREMEASSNRDHRQGIPKPNLQTYNTCLKACRNHKDGKYVGSAETLLSRLQENPTLRPDSYTYNTVIQILARSNRVDKARRAFRILKDYITSHISTSKKSSSSNRFVFNAVLNVCAFSNKNDPIAKIDAIRITHRITDLMAEYKIEENDVTYASILRTYSNFLPRNGRDGKVKEVFRRATQEGYVSAGVLTQFRFAASPYLYRDVIGIYPEKGSSGSSIMEIVPKEWTRKIASHKKKIRRREQ